MCQRMKQGTTIAVLQCCSVTNFVILHFNGITGSMDLHRLDLHGLEPRSTQARST